MTARLLDGDAVASRIKMQLAERVQRLLSAGCTPGLGTILVGDDPSSVRYVEMKIEECAEIGIRSFDEHLGADTSQREIEEIVDRFNADDRVHSILVQLPLPDGVNDEEVLLRVNPEKDVDGLHPTNLGRLVMGSPGPLPCTPNGIVELLAAYDVPVEGQHVVVIGRGLTIGRPLALLLAMRRPHCNAAVSVVHTGVEHFAETGAQRGRRLSRRPVARGWSRATWSSRVPRSSAQARHSKAENCSAISPMTSATLRAGSRRAWVASAR